MATIPRDSPQSFMGEDGAYHSNEEQSALEKAVVKESRAWAPCWTRVLS